MPKDYNEMLNALNKAGIKYDRWYTIDNFFYIGFLSLYSETIEYLKTLFVEVDVFLSYNVVAVDMNKQPGDSPKTPSRELADRVKKYRDSKVSEPYFEL